MITMLFILTCFHTLALLVFCDLTQSYNVSELDGNALYKAIFDNYNPNVRPLLNFSEPVIVNISLDLVKILEVDEINQTFKVTVNLLVTWVDEFLRWNESEYGGISKIVFPLDRNIWSPDLMNWNAAYNPGEFGQKYAFPSVYSYGLVALWTRVNLETQCEIHTKKYPVDTQHCSVAFTTFGSTDFEVRIRNTSGTTNMYAYRKVAEWAIANNFVSTEFEIVDSIHIYRIIRHNFTLQRTCTSCVMNVIVPIIILALLGLLAFFVPTESGEKLTYPMSIFLTLAVFLTIITISLPESVDGVSYISSFVTFELAISATTLLCTIITLRIHHEMGETSIPKVALLMVKYFRRNSDILQVKDCSAHTDVNNGVTNKTIRGKRETNGISTTDPYPTFMEQRNVFNSKCVKWDHVSDAFDMMMFAIIFATQIIAVVTFLTLILI